MRSHRDSDVYEPFCGSGTALIAAEQLGRRCLALEIEPRYVKPRFTIGYSALPRRCLGASRSSSAGTCTPSQRAGSSAPASWNFEKNPIVALLSGPLGTGDLLWPSAFRHIGALPPAHLSVEEDLKPIEENGFTLVDFTPETVTLRYFRWNVYRESEQAIDTLQPFRTTELRRPG
jgi:hypothetical protein